MLRTLNVSNNNLYEIQRQLFVDFSSNNVKVRLHHLDTLNLWLNQIGSVSATAFWGLINMQSLLQGNKIKQLPDEVFPNLTSLRMLDLSNNNIRQLGINVFGSSILSNLSLFSLSNNNIEQLHLIHAFSARLRLSRNKLTALDIRMFAPLRGLRVLPEGENELTEVEDDLLSTFDKLTELEINNNRLTFLPALKEQLLLPLLRHIRIEGNPWQCLCLEELSGWLHARLVGYATSSSAYYSGRKPLCIVTPVELCVRDLQAVRELGIVESYEHI